MFDKITSFMDEKLSTPMAKLAEQRHLRAVRDGIIATLPLIIVSSMFLVVALVPQQLPADWGITKFVAEHAGKILLPYRMSMFIMTLYAVFGMGYSLAKSYKLDPLSGGILAELGFMLTLIPVMMPEVTKGVTALATKNEELATLVNGIPAGWVLPIANLGSAGMFVGIVVSFIAVEIFRFTTTSGFKIRMPEQVPDSVARSFEALTPTLLVLFFVSTITMWLDVDVHGLMGQLVSPLISGSDSLPAVLGICFLGMFFWVFGIHGWSIVGSLARPLWIVLLDKNIDANAIGEAVPHIAAEPFYQWFIMIGGAGCTIGLAILFLTKSKSSYGKTLGKTAFVPVLFNINEPMIFGAPIVLNPMLMIPFIITPLIAATIAWFATSLGLVNHVIATAPWVLPGPIGAFLATGADWRAAVLNILLIIMSVFIYYPFFKLYDNSLLKEEHAEIASKEAA